MSNAADTKYTPQPGDIVLAPFPFTDPSITKLRPAIILSVLPHEAFLVVYITSAATSITSYDLVLEPNQANQLKVPSLARANRLTIIAKSHLGRQLGTLCSEQRRALATKLNGLSAELLRNDTK